MSRTAGLAAVLLALGCATAATSPAKPKEPQVAQVAKNGDRLVCTRERETGSHMLTEVCRWESTKRDQAQQAQDGMRRDQRPTPATDTARPLGPPGER